MFTKITLFMRAFLIGTLFIDVTFCFPMEYGTDHLRFARNASNDENEIEIDKETTIIDDLQSILESSSKILRGIIEIKTRVVGPALEGVGQILDSLSKSQAIEKSAKAVATVGAAGIKASTGIVSAVTNTNTTDSQIITKAGNSDGDIGGRLVRLGICGIVCPFQNGEEREECYKVNCGKPNKIKRNKNNTKTKDQSADV